MYLSPTPVQQYFDNNGVPLVGGQLFVYEAGTTTKQAAYTDSSGATPLPNPVILNSRGEVAPAPTATSCGLWLDPTLSYKLVLAPATDTDPPTNPIWTVDQIVSADAAVLAALASYEATLAGVPVGAMMAYGGTTAPTGWLLCYGQAVSRTTYAALYAVLGNAYGAGDGSTTFNLPDKRGRISVGKDDMGGTAANRVTNAVSGITATTLGASGGDQNAQTDTLSASATAVTSISDPGHVHQETIGQGTGGSQTAWNVTNTGNTVAVITESTETGYTSITASTVVTPTVTSGLTGASQNMPPVEVDNWIIYSGV